MGCRSGITRRLHSVIATWLSDGTGGFRAVLGLGAFAIARSPRWPNSIGCWPRCLTHRGEAAPTSSKEPLHNPVRGAGGRGGGPFTREGTGLCRGSMGSCQHDVGRGGGGHMGGTLIAQGREIEDVDEMLAGPEQLWRDGHVQ